MSELDSRVTELELKLMEQQALVQSLSDVLYQQQKSMDSMELKLSKLTKKLEAEPGLVDASERERPPHF